MTGDQLSRLLAAHGLDDIERARKQALCDLALQRFSRDAGGEPALALWVPGRIEVFGKHTDYCGGHSLVGPVPRGFAFVARQRADRVVSMTDAARGERFAVDLNALGLEALDPAAAPTGWRRYAATTVRRLHRNFNGAVKGADIVFASDLPPSSGMSSSSALMVGLAAMLVRLGDIEARPEWRAAIAGPRDEAGYYACIENGLSFAGLGGDAGVGTHGGSEDHIALVCGRAGQMSAWRFVPIRHVADVAIPADWMFVIASSGVAAKKTGGARDAYNRLSFLAATLLDLWNSSQPPASSLHAALATDVTAPERMMSLIHQRSPFDGAQGRPTDGAQGRPTDRAQGRHAASSSVDLADRLTHFVREDARIPAAVDAFRAADRDRIASLSADSQADAERLLRNQVPETIALADAARSLGAFGASSFGAGFGGSVWALVDTQDAADFAARWLSDYKTAFPARDAATVFVAPPGPSLTWLR
jgi:galactokinase